jgi:hypothetical protein
MNILMKSLDSNKHLINYKCMNRTLLIYLPYYYYLLNKINEIKIILMMKK